MDIELEDAIFRFTQDSNCLDETGNIEMIQIECKSSIGIDSDGSCFYVLKTDGWSIDKLEDLKELFERIEKSLFPEEKKYINK